MENNKSNFKDELKESPTVNEFLERKELENMVLKKLLQAIEKDQEKKLNIIKKSIPAAALISRSFKTGMLKPSTSSPNFIIFFIFILFFIQ